MISLEGLANKLYRHGFNCYITSIKNKGRCIAVEIPRKTIQGNVHIFTEYISNLMEVNQIIEEKF